MGAAIKTSGSSSHTTIDYRKHTHLYNVSSKHHSQTPQFSRSPANKMAYGSAECQSYAFKLSWLLGIMHDALGLMVGLSC
jgi:hypothetical protein